MKKGDRKRFGENVPAPCTFRGESIFRGEKETVTPPSRSLLSANESSVK